MRMPAKSFAIRGTLIEIRKFETGAAFSGRGGEERELKRASIYKFDAASLPPPVSSVHQLVKTDIPTMEFGRNAIRELSVEGSPSFGLSTFVNERFNEEESTNFFVLAQYDSTEYCLERAIIFRCIISRDLKVERSLTHD